LSYRKKLRSVGPKKQSNERDDVWQSAVHYDTGSESEDEYDMKDEPKTVVKPEEEVVQIEESETPGTSSAARALLYLIPLLAT
jgi:hypothetical protein